MSENQSSSILNQNQQENQKIEVKLRDKKLLQKQHRLPSGDLERPFGIVEVVQPEEIEEDLNLTNSSEFFQDFRPSNVSESPTRNSVEFSQEEPYNWNPKLESLKKQQDKTDSLDSQQAQACCTKLAFNIYNKAVEGAKKHLPKNKQKNRYSGAFPRSFGEDFHSLGPEGFYYLDDAQTECSLDYRDIEFNRDSYLINGAEVLPELSEDEFYRNNPKKQLQVDGELKSTEPQILNDINQKRQRKQSNEMDPPRIPENTPMGSVENFSVEGHDLKPELKRKAPSLFEKLFKKNKPKHDMGDGKSSKARSEPREVEREKNFRAQSLPPASLSGSNKHNQRQQPPVPPPSFKISEDGKLWFQHKTIPPPMNPDEAYLSNVTRQSPIKLVYGKPPEIIVQEVTNLSEAVDTLPRSSTPASIDDVAEKTMIDILDDAIRQLREESNIPIHANENQPPETSQLYEDNKSKPNNPNKRKPNSFKLKKPKFLKKFERKPTPGPDRDEISNENEFKFETTPDISMSDTPTMPEITIEEVKDIELDLDANIPQLDEIDSNMEIIQPPNKPGRNRFAMKKPKIFEKKFNRSGPSSFGSKLKIRSKNKDNSNNPKSPYMKKLNGKIPSWKDTSKKLFPSKSKPYKDEEEQPDTKSRLSDIPESPDSTGSNFNRRFDDPIAVEIEVGIPLDAPYEEYEEQQQSPSKLWTSSPFHRYPDQQQQSPPTPSIVQENIQQKSPNISIPKPEIIVLPETPEEIVPEKEPDFTTTSNYRYKPPEIIVKIPLNAKSDYDTDYNTPDMIIQSPPQSPKFSPPEPSFSGITMPEPEFILSSPHEIPIAHTKQQEVDLQPKQFEPMENIKEIGVTYEPPELMYGEEPSDGIVKPMKDKVERIKNMAGSFGQSFKTKMKDLIQKKPVISEPKVVDVTLKSDADPSTDFKETDLDDINNHHSDFRGDPMMNNQFNEPESIRPYDGFNFDDGQQQKPSTTRIWDVPVSDYHVDVTVDDEEPPDNPREKKKSNRKFRLKMPNLSGDGQQAAKSHYHSSPNEQDTAKNKPTFSQKNRERLQQIQHQARKSFGQISDRFKQQKQIIQERTRSFKSKSPTPPPRPPAPQYRQNQYDPYGYDLHFASDSELSPGTGVDSLRRSKVFQELADTHQRLEMYMSPVDRHEPRRPPRRKTSGPTNDKMFNRSMPSLGHAMRPRVKPPRPPPPCINKLAATSCQSVPLQISIIPCEDEIPLGTSTSSIWTNGSKPRQRFPRQQRVPPEMFYRNVRLGYRPKKSYVELLQKSQPFYNLAAQQTIERSQSTGQLYGARHTSPPGRRNKGQFPVAPIRKSRTLYVKTKIDPKQHPNWIGLGSKPPMSPPLVGSRATSVASNRHPTTTMYNDYNPYTTEDEYESTNLDQILFEKFDYKNAQPFYRLPPQSTMTLKSVSDLNWEPYTWKVQRCRSFTELEVRERLRKQQLRNQQQAAAMDEEPSTPDSTDTIVAKQSLQTLRSERAQSTQPHRSYNNKSSNPSQIRTGQESMPKRIMQWLSSTKSLDTWQNRNKPHQQKSTVPPPRPPLPPPRMGGISRATSPTLTTNNSSNSMFYVSNNNSLSNKPNNTTHKNDLNNYYYYNQNVDNFFIDEQRENGNKTPTNRPLPPPPVPPRPRLIPAHYALKQRPETRDVACDTSENGFLKFCEQQSSISNQFNQSPRSSQLVNGIADRNREKSISVENDDELTLVEEKHFSNNNNNNQLINGKSFNKFNNYQDNNVDTSIASVYTDARSHQTNTFSNKNQQQQQQPNSNGNNNLLNRQWSSDEDTINDDLSSLSSSHYQSVLESPTGTLLQQQQQSQTQKNDSFLHRYSSLINQQQQQQQQQPTIMSTTTTNDDDNKKISPTNNDLQQNQIMPSSPHQQQQSITTPHINEQQQQFMQQYTSERSSIVSEEEEEEQQQQQQQKRFDDDIGDNSHYQQQKQQDLDKILMNQFSQTTTPSNNDDGVAEDDDATETSSIKQSTEDQPIRNNKDKKNRQSCISTESSESTTSSTSTSSTISSSSNTFSYSLEPINIINNNNSSSSSTLASSNSIINKESLVNEEIITSSITPITESETTSSLSSSLSSIIINTNKKKNKKTTQKKFSLTEPPIEISRPRTNTDIQLFQSGSSPNNNHKQPSLRENLSSLPKSTPNGSKPDKRYYCAYELYTTERDYVDVLVMLTEEFKNAIKPYVTPKWLETFFKPLDSVAPINKKLLEELQKRVTEEWDDNPKLSDLIIEICPYFKEYSIYIREFDRINFMLDEASQRFDDFEKVLREFENGDRCRKLTVKSYLLKPIQRLPQYRLMLQQYSKCLNEETDLEYEATQKAMKIVSDVVEHIERESEMAERSLTLNELRNCIITTKPIKIVVPGRVLIRRGQLDKVSRKEVHVRYFILFNDVLFYLTPVMNGMYKLKEELPLLGMQVEKSPNFDQEFIVRSVKRSFALLTKDTQEREEWIKDLRDAIADHTEKQQSFNKNRYSTTSIPDHTQIHSNHDLESLSSSSPQTTLRRPSDHQRTLSIMSTESSEQFSSLEPTSLSYQSINTFKLGDLAPVWLHDNRVTFCYSCKSQFTFLNRRHHCRACGQIFCSDCSSNQFALKYLDYKPDRVCDDCYEKLSSQQNQAPVISQSASNSPPTTQRTTTSLFDRNSCIEQQDLTNNPLQDQENENIDLNHNQNNENGGQKTPPKIMVQQESPQISIKSGNGDSYSSSNVFSYSSFFKKNRSNSFHDLRHDQVKITPVVDGNNFNANGGVGQQQSQPSQQLTALMRNNNIRLSSRMMNKQKHVSSVLVEVSATDPQALISGWLQKYVQKKGWKRYWFVIKNMVLYTFKASEDVRALETNPLPGYEVLVSDESIKGYPANLIIKLKHHCQSTQYFYAETPEDFKRWFECFKESALLTK